MKHTEGEMKKDFDISPGLDDPLQKGEAVVWYLGHSGWAVKTKNHLLVFDYSERAAPVSEPRLANGYINPSEIQNQFPHACLWQGLFIPRSRLGTGESKSPDDNGLWRVPGRQIYLQKRENI